MAPISLTLVTVTTITLLLLCLRSVLLRGAKMAREQQVLEIPGQAGEGIPARQWASTAHVNSVMRPAPVYSHNARPPPVHVHSNTSGEVAIEPLPVYEAPPPKYDNVIKEAQPPIDMRDLERGEPSAGAEAGNNPPEYNQESGGDGGAILVRVATVESHMTLPEEGGHRRGISSMARPLSGYGLFGRLWR